MGVRRIDFLDEEGVLACLTGDDTDLDDALLAILVAERDGGYVEWDDQDDEADRPTRILHGAYHWRGEVEVGKFRKQPCICGCGHKWDLMPARPDEDGWDARGSFWGVHA